MAKRPSKKLELHRAQARALVDILLAEKDLKIHFEARYGSGAMPGKKAFDAVELSVCKRNQTFLDRIIEDLQALHDQIDAMPKQGDMVDNMEEKEAQLKEELLGPSAPEEEFEETERAVAN